MMWCKQWIHYVLPYKTIKIAFIHWILGLLLFGTVTTAGQVFLVAAILSGSLQRQSSHD